MILSSEPRMLLAFLVALFSSLFVIPRLANIARAIGLIDRPDARKVHQTPRPLVGGIGIIIATTFSSLLLIPIKGFRGFFLGLSVLLLVGFLDDFRELGPRRKFLAQIFSCFLIMYLGDTYLLSFGNLLGLGEIVLPDINIVIWAVTIFCVVGVINSLNLIDGLDGLAGSVAFIAFSTFALHASFADNYNLMLLNLAFAGAVLGFLRFNWQPSIVFMGDAGSLCLGFALAYMSIVMTQGTETITSPVCPLLILAIPITDTIVVMTRRMFRGVSPFKADQFHLHHILMHYGLGAEQTVRIIVGFCLLLCGVTLLDPFYVIPDYFFFGIFLIYLFGYIAATEYLMKKGVRYEKREKPEEREQAISAAITRSVLHTADYLRIFRKDTRYQVRVGLSCFVGEEKKEYVGEIVDLSRRGCRAQIRNLTSLQSEVMLELRVIHNDMEFKMPVPAHHIWSKTVSGIPNHGFQFEKLIFSDRTIEVQFVVD